jgi:hypothetical protein
MDTLRSRRRFTCQTPWRRGILVGLLLLAGLASQIVASPSFVTTTSFFQGFDLETAVREGDPAHVRLVFGAAGQTEFVPVSDREDAFAFSSAVDFSFGYKIGAPDPIRFVPEHIAGMAVIEGTAFETVDAGILDKVELTGMPGAVSIEPDDTVLVVTTDHVVFKIGNIVQLDDIATLSFSYQQLTQSQIPEPTTLVLLVLGLIGLITVITRKHR